MKVAAKAAIAAGIVIVLAALVIGWSLLSREHTKRPKRPPATASSLPVAGTLTPEAFGARGDGRTDDTAALQAALDAMPRGGRLVLARGRTYLHDAVLHISVPGTVVTGGGRLLATRPQESAVQVDADDVTVDGVTLACAPPDRRYTAYEQMKLRASHRHGLVLKNVTVERSAAAGIFLEDVSDFTIRDVRISDTEADGIHLTGGSNHGTVVKPVVTRPGDDGVAVVSYQSDPAPTEHIRVVGPTVVDQRWGRGLSVVGGRDIRYEDITVTGSAGAAVYVATEGEPFFTQSVSNVTVVGGRITRASTDPAIGHSALLVAVDSPDTTVTGVTFSGLALQEPPGPGKVAVELRCEAGQASGITIRSVSVSADYGTRFASGCAAPRTLDLSTVS